MPLICVALLVLLALGGLVPVRAQDSLAEQQTDFGLRVFSQLAGSSAQQENLVLSPLGLASVLAMAQLGAAGPTRQALNAALGFSLHVRGAQRQQRLLQGELAGSEGDVAWANGVLVERKLNLEQVYRRALYRAFGCRPHQVDFSRPQQARQVINAWLSDRTAGAIPEFLAPGSLTVESRLVLLSALHLEARWRVPFDPRLTQQRLFNCANGSSLPVDMMQMTGRFSHGQFVAAAGDVDYEVLELPYEDDALSFLLVAPLDAWVPASTLLDELSSHRIRQWRAEMRRVRRQLALPRFTLDQELDLKAPLVRMGLGDLFDPATADFTRITADERLFVSEVMQKVKMEVNEVGMEASAATAAVMFSRMAVEELTLDRPFLFLIQHRPTGAVLFSGQFNHPQQH